jgi:hypothetical protein
VWLAEVSSRSVVGLLVPRRPPLAARPPMLNVL